MDARCLLSAIVALMMIGSFSHIRAGDEIDLRSGRAEGEISRVEVLLEVGGDLTLVEENKVRPLKMSVVGTMAYGEKLLSAGDGDRTGAHSVRHYERADAVIKVDQGVEKPVLRDSRRLIAVSVDEGHATTYCPSWPLSREELDLLEVPASSLLVEGLLPERPVAPGDQWQHGDQLLTALLGLDAVSQTDVSSTFKELKDDAAQIEIRGTVAGAIGGVSTDLEIKGRYKFDVERRRITWMALLVKEKRSIGHVAPGVDVVARLQMRISPNAVYAQLDDAALAKLPLKPRPETRQLAYESSAGHYRFVYDRTWHVMNDTAEALAMRLVDRGELVAQCNVTRLAPAADGKAPTLATFQEDIQKALGKNFGRFLSAAESSNAHGYTVYRATIEGEVEDLPIQWIYYLVADERGRQAVFAFTLESKLVERFEGADSPIINSVELGGGAVDTAARPTPRAR